MNATGLAVFVYGVLVLAGGVIGYTATGSQASLVAGGVFGGGILASAVAILKGKRTGLRVAFGLAVVLTLFFGSRFAQSGVFMPGGLMALLSILAVIVVSSALRRGAR